MKVPLSWLREMCPVDLSVEDLAHALTAIGAHVEGILRPWDGLDGVLAVRVLEVSDHPDSDRLCVARVDTGSGEMQVVVGVRNMAPGDVVPWAGPGARVPALPEPLGVRRLRGVESNGMLCSPWELGLAQEHAGILILPPDTPVGADVKERFGLDEAVLDIEVKSNRPDLMSVAGVAREASAATGAPFTLPDAGVEEDAEPASEAATVEILDLERCPRYLARVIRDVKPGPSPLAVQARLTACGMRPLSNVVDATNYVLLELGHPLHPFDLHQLEGPAIVVRRAADGERLVTLDDVERVLSSEDLLIADRARGVAVAGVMGSAPVEVSTRTSDVLLESAYFDRVGVLHTARRLGLKTEASIRFERGADPEAVPLAAARAAKLIRQWAGGRILAGAIDVGSPPPRRHVALRPERASLVLGYPVSAGEAEEALSRLGIATRRSDGSDGANGAVVAEIPGRRPDLAGEEDLIEEVVRAQGYEHVPTTLPKVRQAGGVAPGHALRRRIREALVRAGLREALTFSFASQADLALAGCREGVRVANPLAADQAFLRPSLVPGLLRALQRGAARGVRGAALFEVGHVFRPPSGADPGKGVDEREFVAGALAGQASAGFPEPQRAFDFLDAKGALEALFGSLGVDDWSLGDPPGEPLHPARSATVLMGEAGLGFVGELHPRVAEDLDLPARTSVFEVDVAALTVLGISSRPVVQYREIPRFPPLRRDLAFLVDAGVPAGEVRDGILSASGGLADPVTLTLFDVFAGAPLPEGKKSLAFSVDFRAPDRTLTDEEADAAVTAIVAHLSQGLGAELRAG